MKFWPFGKKQTRNDGFLNLATGAGVSGVDKTTGSVFICPHALQPQHLEDLYTGNDMAALIVDTQVDEALRLGAELRVDDAEETQDLNQWVKRNKVLQKLGDAARWGKLYGAGAVILGTLDGASPEQELQLKSVRSLDYLHVIDRTEMTPHSWYPNGDVKQWLVMPMTVDGGENHIIHESRLVFFGGVKTTKRKRFENGGFDRSVLDRVNEVIEQFAMTFNNMGVLLADGNQAVFKMMGLSQALAADPTGTVIQKRFQLMQFARSVHRALVLDAGDGVETEESFERQTANFAGLADVVDRFILRLSSAARIPATVLMGQSPAGMNATGESDLRWFYDRTDSYRTNELEPALMRIIDVLRASAQWGRKTDEVSISWPELWGASESDKATARFTQAQADAIWIDQGVLTPEEVALSRFGTGEFSFDVSINDKGIQVREEALDEEYESFGEDDEAELLEGATPTNQAGQTSVASGKVPANAAAKSKG